MDISEAIKKRRCVRKFLDVPVESEKVMEILEAGSRAPSSGNLQPVKYVVVANEKTISKIADACLQQVWIETAPVIVIVCVDVDRVKKHYGKRGAELYAIQDSAAAIENMFLMATSLEVATCWIGAFSEEMIQSAVSMPENVRPMAVLPLGYADEKPLMPPKLELRDIVFFETFGNKIKAGGLWPLEKHAAKLKKGIEVVNSKMKK